jgi:hypothetical protein
VSGRALVTLHAGPPPTERLPPVARPGDGNVWVTGRCWFWCGREAALVVWVGPATVAGTTAGVYACGACLRALADQIIATRLGSDMTEGIAPAHAPPAGRHRRTT